MKRLFVTFNQVLTCLLTVLLAFGPWQYAVAAPDDFVDDSAIYIGTPSKRPPPNVLLIIDNSNATLNTASGSAYNPLFVYNDGANDYPRWNIYVGDNQGNFTSLTVANATNALENLSGCPGNVADKLLNVGMYTASGTESAPNIKNGSGVCETAPKGDVYALGNYLNYLNYVQHDDGDWDNDGALDGADVCANSDDGLDADDDGVPDGCDNCRTVANATQADGDNDKVGDACDLCSGFDDSVDVNANHIADCVESPPDADGDMVPDYEDRCPGENDLFDSDGDGVFACLDKCPGKDDRLDADNDKVPDGCDRCPGKNDLLLDETGCDVALADDDGDGVPNDFDRCPGHNDNAQSDPDTVPDGCDACPGFNDFQDLDRDLLADGCDLCQGDNTLGDPDNNGVCGDQRPTCLPAYSYVIVEYTSGNKTYRYELTGSHTSTNTNRPGSPGGGAYWAILGANDQRVTNWGVWEEGKCYVKASDYCNPAPPNKNSCVLLLPDPVPVAGVLPVPLQLLAAAMPPLAAGAAALLALDTLFTAEAAAGPPVGVSGESQRKIIYDAVTMVVDGARATVNFGALSYANNSAGASILYDMANLATTEAGSNAAFEAFKASLPGPGENDGYPVMTSQTNRPQAEALHDAGYYFNAAYADGAINNAMTRIPSDAVNDCGYNHIILITNGLSNGDNSPKLADNIGDADGDGYADEYSYGEGSHYSDDVAAFLKNTKGIKTHVVLAFQPSDPLLEHTAAMGGGKFYAAYDAQELAEALSKLLISIVLEADTAFVAPVVPASTTNRTISSDRVYLGLFKPQIDEPWIGNIKKYRVGGGDQLIDSQNNPATNATTGDFIATSRSYWGTTLDANGTLAFQCNTGTRSLAAGDGGIVGCGGIGGTLTARNITSDPRKIYTYPPGSSSRTLSDASNDNRFSVANVKLTASLLAVNDPNATKAAADRSRVIRFVQGYKVDSTVLNAQRDWLLGDILHSKPMVFNYTNYPGSAENTCPSGGVEWPADIGGENFNSTVIFVGANDGMLHAFRDCDGRELWSFIPPELLPSLKKMLDPGHYYYVDSPTVSYVHDANNDNIINATAGDKVYLLFSLRRGGSSNDLNDAGPWGGYYILDVSRPTAPVFVGSITNQTSGLAMLGETWSQPRLAKIMDGSAMKVVAFIGGGYDKNEDLRYGATQGFPDTTNDVPGTTTIVPAQFDDGGLLESGGAKRSPGSSTQYYPDGTHLRGRGMYAIEIAELQGSAPNITPSFSNMGAVLWSYDHADNANLTFSIPSDLTVVTDNNNFARYIYVGDTGGRMWRFDVSSPTIGSWTGQIILDANSGTGSDVGRKFFYRPAVAYVNGLPMLWFGSGDRAHPLNHDVVDRLYMLIDRGQLTSDGINETKMVDLTANQLQDGDPTNDNEILCKLGKLSGEACAGFSLSPPYYGWFIKLNWDYDTDDDGDTDSNGGAESSIVGEKVLASAVMFNREAFYTTYSPYPDPSANDPCQAGNLGRSRLYHINFETGESVYNYEVGNDTTDVESDPRAQGMNGAVLLRADRVRNLGEGIPSGIVTLIDASGKVTMMISTSNRVDTYNAPDVRLISPVYWINW